MLLLFNLITVHIGNNIKLRVKLQTWKRFEWFFLCFRFGWN